MVLGEVLAKMGVECLKSVMTEWKSKKHVEEEEQDGGGV